MDDVVEIEAWLAHLIPQFLANRLDEVKRLREAVEARDFEGIRRIGHNLRGAAGGYGFMELEKLGARLEAAGRGEDDEEARACAEEIERRVRTVKVVYR